VLKLATFASALALMVVSAAQAASERVTVHKIDANGVGPAIGTLQLRDTKQGLRIVPHLAGLPPGQHGFHVHDKPDCGPGMQNGTMAAGFAAGGHYDPMHTGKHLGPNSTEGHRGDLPVLVVDAKGAAHVAVLAPHLTVQEVKGHSIMIHVGGDNYSDQPLPLGGGGARIACAVVK
jgi:superoxide dismutase, Cu-Zn family